MTGRPSKYRKEFAVQAEKLCALGATDDELADFFEVSTRTVYRWKLEQEAFCQALKAGKELSDERVARSLYQRATGYTYVEQQAFKVRAGQYEELVQVVDVERHAPADTTAAIFWLKNRRPEEWRDKREHEVTGKDGGPIILWGSQPE